MKKFFLFVGLLLLSNQLMAQSNWKNFWKQSPPIKKWIVFHPFKAKKAFRISNEAKRISDSIVLTNLLDQDKSGGQVDAFRHAYWMARLHQEIGKGSARSLGRAYERQNRIYFRRNKLEDGILPDKPSKQMDLFNNEVGLSFTKKNGSHSNVGLIYKIVNSIEKGELKIIKKDKKGMFLTCSGEKIPSSELQHKWINKKCVVSSKKS
jgi:hypothetical protein